MAPFDETDWTDWFSVVFETGALGYDMYQTVTTCWPNTAAALHHEVKATFEPLLDIDNLHRPQLVQAWQWDYLVNIVLLVNDGYSIYNDYVTGDYFFWGDAISSFSAGTYFLISNILA